MSLKGKKMKLRNTKLYSNLYFHLYEKHTPEFKNKCQDLRNQTLNSMREALGEERFNELRKNKK